MSDIHTEIVAPAHAYTRSKSPWILDRRHDSVYGTLIHYISGGGMRMFGRTVRQEEVRRRQRRFCIEVSVLAVLWLVLLLA